VTECILRKLADDIRLADAVDLDKRKYQAQVNLTKFNKDSCKALHLS